MTTGDLSTTFTLPIDYPGGSDLCTLDDVREFLQEQALDTAQDGIITALISRASRTIMRWTGREFAPATNAATRTLLYETDGRLSLGRWELRALTTATLDSDQVAPIPLVTGTDVFLRPLPAPDGVYQWLELPTYAATVGTRTGREITITGDWGWPTVPDDVRHACIVTVGTWLKRDISAFSRTFNLDEGRTERPDALPAAVTAILWQYRTPVLA